MRRCNNLVAGLKKKEAAVQKPAQVVAALPDVLTLPEPITIAPERPASESGPYKTTSSMPDGVSRRSISLLRI